MNYNTFKNWKKKKKRKEKGIDLDGRVGGRGAHFCL